jgi:hypothetical protein
VALHGFTGGYNAPQHHSQEASWLLGNMVVEDIVFFLAGRITRATGSRAHQYSRPQGDQSFRQMRAHMRDVIQNVVNMKKPHDVLPLQPFRWADIHGERLP